MAALPLSYAVALRLQDAGAGSELIGRALGIDEDAVPTLLDVAHRKLAEHHSGRARVPRADPEAPERRATGRT